MNVLTLYIPDVVDVYPDMVGEEWTVDDVKAFAEEYKINLDITEEETSDYPEGRVIYQNRSAGSSIIKGVTLKVKVAKKAAPKAAAKATAKPAAKKAAPKAAAKTAAATGGSGDGCNGIGQIVGTIKNLC